LVGQRLLGFVPNHQCKIENDTEAHQLFGYK